MTFDESGILSEMISRAFFWCFAVAALSFLAACGEADTEESDLVADTDLDCSAENLGADDQIDLRVAHVVIDGALGEVCFGEPDDVVVEAFNELAAITPPLQLNDLGLFAGFVWDGPEDERTLAYVSPVDDEGSQFTLAVGLDAFADDRQEARLTNAHEFAHVFTQTEPELDRSVWDDECETYWNGDGCFREDSLMWRWMSEFWDQRDLASIDPEEEPLPSDGERRCSLDDSFFGEYAASNPEEDFAEAFSAYVFDVAAATDGQQAKLDWIAEQPGLAEFRERAEAAGMTPIENTFDLCG